VADTAPGFLDRHHFLLRRLHSLSGIIPVGAFLINHLLANSTAFLGQKHFDHHIGIIHDLPWLVVIEFVFIFIPIAFHAIYGILIAWQGKLNQNQYPYMDNWRYTLQRITAYITIVFILVHLAHFRFATSSAARSTAVPTRRSSRLPKPASRICGCRCGPGLSCTPSA